MKIRPLCFDVWWYSYIDVFSSFYINVIVSHSKVLISVILVSVKVLTPHTCYLLWSNNKYREWIVVLLGKHPLHMQLQSLDWIQLWLIRWTITNNKDCQSKVDIQNFEEIKMVFHLPSNNYTRLSNLVIYIF